MKVTIIREDNTVYVDGKPHQVDCSGLPTNFHALQWDGVAGEVEYAAVRCSHCLAVSKKPNEVMADLSPYQAYIDAWQVAEAAALAAAEGGGDAA